MSDSTPSLHAALGIAGVESWIRDLGISAGLTEVVEVRPASEREAAGELAVTR